MTDTLTRAQIRGARAMLDWSIVDLSIAAEVSVSSVKRAEDDHARPISDDLAIAIQNALEAEGVSFLADQGSGTGMRLMPIAGRRPPRHR